MYGKVIWREEVKTLQTEEMSNETKNNSHTRRTEYMGINAKRLGECYNARTRNKTKPKNEPPKMQRHKTV